MNGHVFQTLEEQPNRVQFKKTMEALETYAKTKLTFVEDLAPLFAFTMGDPQVPLPADIPEDATPTVVMIQKNGSSNGSDDRTPWWVIWRTSTRWRGGNAAKL